MKANYLPRNRSKSNLFKRILILCGVFVLGVVIMRFFGPMIVTAVSPVWRADNAVSTGLRHSIDYFKSRNALVAENTELKDKVANLEAENLSLLGKQAQESSLLELLGRSSKADVIAAAVLARPPQTPYDIIVIDAGAKNQVKIGSRVSLPEGPIIGKVSEVFSTSAKVDLFSANGEKTDAILERGNVPVVLEGRGGGNFRFVLPREVEIKPGDRVLSTDLSPSLLAVVADVSSKATDSFKEVLAQGPSNIFALRFVFITP